MVATPRDKSLMKAPRKSFKVELFLNNADFTSFESTASK